MKTAFLRIALIWLLVLTPKIAHTASSEPPSDGTRQPGEPQKGLDHVEKNKQRQQSDMEKLIQTKASAIPVKTVPPANASASRLPQTHTESVRPGSIQPPATMLPISPLPVSGRHLGSNLPVIGGSAKASCDQVKTQTASSMGINGTGMSHRR